MYGSSPRLWGDYQQNKNDPTLERFIPTPVGRLDRCERRDTDPAVHPHACGEILDVRDFRDRKDGSSPRLWGDLFRHFAHPPIFRFIPTPVGRLTHRKRDGFRRPVHPHACGEIRISQTCLA